VNQSAVLLAVPAAGQAAKAEGIKYNKKTGIKGRNKGGNDEENKY
jgi:hypothetical protein